MEQKYHEFYRGEIYYADMNTRYDRGAEAVRPVLVMLTDQGLYGAPTVVVTEVQRAAGKPVKTL